MRCATSILLLLGLGLNKSIAKEDHHEFPPGQYLRILRRDTGVWTFSGRNWPTNSFGGWQTGKGGSGGQPTLQPIFPTQSSNMGAQPASSDEDGEATEVITVPNGGTNLNGNGANGGSIFVNHGQVLGTPGTTETIASPRPAGRRMKS